MRSTCVHLRQSKLTGCMSIQSPGGGAILKFCWMKQRQPRQERLLVLVNEINSFCTWATAVSI